MTHQQEIQSSEAENQDIQFVTVDEKMLPELIQGQIGKLKELNEGVITALEAAKKAEDKAEAAKKLSAGWSLFGGEKKKAIEGLQQAGIELAGAVQSGAKAQKLSFDFQKRIADVTKYLFDLGVGNIAANRVVVRELELRLSGASKEQLSDLARQEVVSVIGQLKEQEDLLRKQERMQERIKEHDSKVKHLLDRTDDLALGLAGHSVWQRNLVIRIDAMDQGADAQQKEILDLQTHIVANKAGLETLTSKLTQASAHAEQASNKFLARSEDLESRLKEQDRQQGALANAIDSMVKASEQQQQTILTLQQQVTAQQASLEKLVISLDKSRGALNVRTALLVSLAITLSAAAYFLH